MKMRIGVLLLSAMLGTAWAQNLDAIQNTRDTLQNVQKKETIDQNAALAVAGQGTTAAPASQPTVAAKPAPSKPLTANSATAAPVKQATNSVTSKPTVTATAKKSKAVTQKVASKKQSKTTVAVNKADEPKKTVAVEDKQIPEESKKKEPREYSAAGRRDPFISPVVSHIAGGGSGCSSGKRCLAVDQIILTGIVKSETGMIAVVVNSMNKAYFLRENDPVFNGYVVKITGDSIIFNQTVEDKLGKPFTREVTKKIATPAV
jgi:Tfp pilus assembly protein PilP